MSPTPRKRPAAAIGDVLKSLFADIENKKTVGKDTVDASWLESAGEEAFKHSRPAALKKSVLTVRVDSSTWLQELSMRKRHLLKGLKRRLGKDRISEIHFKIGELE